MLINQFFVFLVLSAIQVLAAPKFEKGNKIGIKEMEGEGAIFCGPSINFLRHSQLWSSGTTIYMKGSFWGPQTLPDEICLACSVEHRPNDFDTELDAKALYLVEKKGDSWARVATGREEDEYVIGSKPEIILEPLTGDSSMPNLRVAEVYRSDKTPYYILLIESKTMASWEREYRGAGLYLLKEGDTIAHRMIASASRVPKEGARTVMEAYQSPLPWEPQVWEYLVFLGRPNLGKRYKIKVSSHHPHPQPDRVKEGSLTFTCEAIGSRGCFTYSRELTDSLAASFDDGELKLDRQSLFRWVEQVFYEPITQRYFVIDFESPSFEWRIRSGNSPQIEVLVGKKGNLKLKLMKGAYTAFYPGKDDYLHRMFDIRFTDGSKLEYSVLPNEETIPQFTDAAGKEFALQRIAFLDVTKPEGFILLSETVGYDMTRVTPSELSCAYHIAFHDSLKRN